jgi:geranylgeranylglycerol-phosphate geranylgeranyltransferase
MLRTGISRTLIGIIRITRFHICILAAFYVLLGAYLGGKVSDLLSPPVLYAALVAGLVVAFGFVINDYHDSVSDTLSKPERSLPSGQISLSTATILALILGLMALVIASFLGPLLAITALLTIILGMLYSYYLKNMVLLGNLTIGLLNASIILYGNLSVGKPIRTVWIAGLLAFLYVSAQEIFYTVRDQEADACANVCTVATHLGSAAALHFFRFFALSFVVAVIAVWFLGLVPSRDIYAAVPCSILPILVAIILLLRHIKRPKLLLVQDIMRLGWFTSLLTVLLMR